MHDSRRSQWQLPPGVEPGTWDYVHHQEIADDYDDYFADHPLFALDDEMLGRWLPPVEASDDKVVADLGCGTARALMPLLERGYHGLAVDLSPLMLLNASRKSPASGTSLKCLCANLVQLDGVQNQCVDHALCLFSTLGMIKGQHNRKKVLSHVHRILKPGGHLFLHVHNFWCNTQFPGGKAWMLRSALRSLMSDRSEMGDKYYPYRGLSNMYLHTFTQSEVTRSLQQAGFQVQEIVPLNQNLSRKLAHNWWLGRLRASGWWIAAQRIDVETLDKNSLDPVIDAATP